MSTHFCFFRRKLGEMQKDMERQSDIWINVQCLNACDWYFYYCELMMWFFVLELSFLGFLLLSLLNTIIIITNVLW